MYISINEAAEKFKLSKRRVQILCEQGRIKGAQFIDGLWKIPSEAEKPADGRRKASPDTQMSLFEDDAEILSDEEICGLLSISGATLKNWIRLKKIVPDVGDRYFSREYIEKTAGDIRSGKNEKLKSRRNKKGISGRLLYRDYVKDPENRALAEQLIAMGELSEAELPLLLADFAVQLFYQKKNIEFEDNEVLPEFLKNDSEPEFKALIQELLSCGSEREAPSPLLKSMMKKRLKFVPGEDSLGFVYISLRDIGLRKLSGDYYTPANIVNELIDNLNISGSGLKFCDPCCGTGNFLLALAGKYHGRAELFGRDCNPISVYIARINLFIADSSLKAEYLREHIRTGDTLLTGFEEKFDVVIGNPPWGSQFSEEQLRAYKAKYRTAAGKGAEAYDMFTEASLKMLRPAGSLAFVLPEAILSVAAHRAVRELLLENCCFKYVSYLGNVFPGVQCPAILLHASLCSPASIRGCLVSTAEKKFTITENREFDPEIMHFNISDRENQCMKAIEGIENAVFLKDKAKFALGIVTGNNKEYLKSEAAPGYEFVLRGNDIHRYSIRTGENYIRYTPELFQQTAADELYRAKEKLFYRFISELPVFAYDDSGLLSLNSCNILIPMIPGLSVKYVLAVLNSGTVAFWTSKKFNSLKLLRSHIERIPIPFPREEQQKIIESKAEKIMQSPRDAEALYRELDEDIFRLYKLSESNKALIREFLQGKNLFLDS